MRSSCYGTPVGDYKGWHTSIQFILNTGVHGSEPLLALMALRAAIENAVFESKRPMVIRFPVKSIDREQLNAFKQCFNEHILYMDVNEIMFAGRTIYATSPIDAWRKHYPHAAV